MSYTPTNWKSGDKVTSTRLNKIEQGIQGNDTEISNLKKDLNEKVNTVNGIAPDENGNIQIETGSGLSQSVKMAILKCFANTAYINTTGSEAFDNLQALFTGGKLANVWLYRFDNNLQSDGLKDFTINGTGVYENGVNGKAYYKAPSTSGIYSVNITDVPQLTGDYTISFWSKTTNPTDGFMVMNTKCLSASYSALTWNDSWTVTAYNGWGRQYWNPSRSYAGTSFFWQSGRLYFRLCDADVVYGRVISLSPPSGFDCTQWHHYAAVRSSTITSLYIDGVLAVTINGFDKPVLFPNQIAFGERFVENSLNSPNRVQDDFGIYIDDFYINDKKCLFESSFNPNDIDYGI